MKSRVRAASPRARLPNDASGFLPHASAGGRRRDARSLLVRRREPHLARSPGSGGAREAHRERPGGAANVARNITALDGQCTLLSVVGNDEAANTLASLLATEK
jgi:hypothetical protein